MLFRSTKPLYRLGLTTFQNKQGLALTTGGAYKATVASGESLAHGAAGTAIGGSGGSTYGDLIAQKVEASNVDIAKVALDMNLLNRGFAAVQAVIDDVTKIIQNVMKIVGG